MSNEITYNLTIDDTSPLWLYSPYGDTDVIDGDVTAGLSSSWVTWYSGSAFLQSLGESPSGDSYHITSLSGASASLSFYGTGVSVYGLSNASYQITFDGAIRSTSASDGILFTTSGESAGIHNVSIIAKPSSTDELLQLNSAVVISEGNASSGTTNDVTIDNQNTTVITYSGDWTPNKTVAGIPSESSTAPFHITADGDASASFVFSGRSVALYGSSTSGHGDYCVTLDGQQTNYNGSSNWLLTNMLMYYQDGLDESKTHTLVLKNLNGGETLSLSSILVKQFSSSSSSASGDSQDGHTTSHAGKLVGAIVGSIAAVFLLSAIGFYLWRRRQSEDSEYDAEEIKHVHGNPLLAPSALPHSEHNTQETEGAVTPYFLGLNVSRQAAGERTPSPPYSSESRELYANGKAGRAAGPPRPPSPAMDTDTAAVPGLSSGSRAVLVGQPAMRPPPRSVPGTAVPDEFSPPTSPMQVSQRSDRTRSGRRSPTYLEHDPAFVERVLEMVVQRIDARSPLDASSSSRHEQPLPPYAED